jgi:hypothetical protein
MASETKRKRKPPKRDSITGAQAIAIVREFFPDYNMGQIDRLLWECTGWPAFWRTDETHTIADCLRAQVKECADDVAAGRDYFERVYRELDEGMEAARIAHEAQS